MLPLRRHAKRSKSCAVAGASGGSGVEAGLHCGDVAGEEASDEVGTDLVPAGHFNVGGLEGGVRGFEKGDETLGFEDANCLFSHDGGFC